MYGGRGQPANPMIAQIRAALNPSFGDHFKITWASIAASTSLDSVPPLLRRAGQGTIPDGGRSNCGPTEPVGSCG